MKITNVPEARHAKVGQRHLQPKACSGKINCSQTGYRRSYAHQSEVCFHADVHTKRVACGEHGGALGAGPGENSFGVAEDLLFQALPALVESGMHLGRSAVKVHLGASCTAHDCTRCMHRCQIMIDQFTGVGVGLS